MRLRPPSFLGISFILFIRVYDHQTFLVIDGLNPSRETLATYNISLGYNVLGNEDNETATLFSISNIRR